MVLQNHIIKKFLLELGTPGYEQSYAMQRRCAAVIKEKLATGLDKVLADNFNAEETVRINRIEIDLGNIYEKSLEEEFSDKLLEAIADKIKKIAAERKSTTTADESHADEEVLLIEALLYFLNNGVLLWSGYKINFTEWEQKVLTAIKAQPYYFTQQFYKAIKENIVVAERLLAQFNEIFIATVIETALPFLRSSISNILILIKQKAPAALQKEIVQEFFKQVIAMAFKIPNLETGTVIKTDKINNEIIAKDNVTGLHIINAAINEVLALISKHMQPAQQAGSRLFNTETVTTKVADDGNKAAEKKAIEQEAVKKEIFIQNGGLVLLHPFLNNLFTSTGLMTEEQFNDTGSAKKAVQLLQYLVNFQTEIPEFLLTLNKILCGLPQAEHLDRFVKLTDEECKEATQMLEAVIAHWSVLKNSSPEALQETFIQRTGKLIFSEPENGWVLHVEKKAVDVLLEKIPWGIGYIKHPWMEYSLRVDW